MFCSHKRRVAVSETVGGRSMLPESKYIFTKVYRTYFAQIVIRMFLVSI
ncbi:hypothetical protein NVP1193O_016 [Vibrio phage 1.193.O._10N.286.52.C6]|nr:hypothetical protein NVP1193O_016 [Vibrio phage 1.193.O._10N.286.52.C6]